VTVDISSMSARYDGAMAPRQRRRTARGHMLRAVGLWGGAFSQSHDMGVRVAACVHGRKKIVKGLEFSNKHKYPLSPTNPRDVPHHGKRAANKDGRSMS